MGTHMQGQSYSPIINARMQPGTAKRLRQKSVLGAQVLRTQAVCRHLGEVVASLRGDGAVHPAGFLVTECISNRVHLKPLTASAWSSYIVEQVYIGFVWLHC